MMATFMLMLVMMILIMIMVIKHIRLRNLVVF
jgi:hypothetical protein